MSRRRRLTTAAAAVALLATGCADKLDRGTVTGKDHTPESVVMMPQYTPMCSGNPPICTQKLIGMIPITTPESWTLHLRDGEKTGDHDVTESEYAKYQVGERYP